MHVLSSLIKTHIEFRLFVTSVFPQQSKVKVSEGSSNDSLEGAQEILKPILLPKKIAL